MQKTKRMLKKEAELGRPLEQVIPELVKQEGSMEAAAGILGVHLNTLYAWCIRLDLERQTVLVKPSN